MGMRDQHAWVRRDCRGRPVEPNLLFALRAEHPEQQQASLRSKAVGIR